MNPTEYADLWIENNFGTKGGVLSEYQAAKYVSAVMTYALSPQSKRKELATSLIKTPSIRPASRSLQHLP